MKNAGRRHKKRLRFSFEFVKYLNLSPFKCHRCNKRIFAHSKKLLSSGLEKIFPKVNPGDVDDPQAEDLPEVRNFFGFVFFLSFLPPLATILPILAPRSLPKFAYSLGPGRCTDLPPTRCCS